MLDAEQPQVRADQVHHRRHCPGAEQRQPLARGRAGVAVAELGRERGADGHQVIARVQPLGDDDGGAERLPVAQVERAREHVDLRARVVDIILADHARAGELQQAGERVAHHRAAAMAHVHRAGRVRRDILDVDDNPRRCVRAAVIVAGCRDRRQLGAPRLVGEPHVDEARPGDVDLRHVGYGAQLFGQRGGERARVRPRRLGEHHGRVGGEVAMRGVARRLDRDVRAVEPARQRARGNEAIEGGVQVRGELRVERHNGERLAKHRFSGKRPRLRAPPAPDDIGQRKQIQAGERH